MKFMIGTKNVAKVNAVKRIVSFHFPQALIEATEVESGVPEQPFGEEETRLGALNRAFLASSQTVDSIGIGLEGGVRTLDGQVYLCNWGAFHLPDGTKFTAAGAQIPLPPTIAQEMLVGKELGPVVDEYFNTHGIRQREGAIGMFTAQVVKRDGLFEHIMQLLIGQFKYHLMDE